MIHLFDWLVILGAGVALMALYAGLALLVGLALRALDRECDGPRMYCGTVRLK